LTNGDIVVVRTGFVSPSGVVGKGPIAVKSEVNVDSILLPKKVHFTVVRETQTW
jgi:hypothetical protein